MEHFSIPFVSYFERKLFLSETNFNYKLPFHVAFKPGRPLSENVTDIICYKNSGHLFNCFFSIAVSMLGCCFLDVPCLSLFLSCPLCSSLSLKNPTLILVQ